MKVEYIAFSSLFFQVRWTNMKIKPIYPKKEEGKEDECGGEGEGGNWRRNSIQ